jgi:hypothetical protein
MGTKEIKPDSVAPPSSSCLLLCDEVMRGTAKNRHVLHGVVSEIFVPSLPTILGPYAAYVRLGNVHGGQKIALSFCRAADDEELFRFEATSPTESDPLDTHTLILPIPPFKIKKPGRYIFRALHAGVPFATNSITVQKFPMPPRRKK